VKPALGVAAAGTIAAAWASAAAPPGNGVGTVFQEVAPASGLAATHTSGATGEYYMPEIMGAGGALFDYDGDDDLDVFVVQGAPLTGSGAPGAGGHRLFRNDLGPSGPRFVDVTATSGLGQVVHGMGAAVGDYDNDGDPDLYVTAFGPNALFRNEGKGTFRDVTEAAGVAEDRWSTSASFFDYDRDGDLDLFVANYLDFTVAGNKRCVDAVGARDYCAPAQYRPVPDRLFRNEGGGRFRDVTDAAGLSRADGPGLGVVAADLDDDGWPDLYVANDGSANQLWINRGSGSFEDRGLVSGTAYNAEGLPEGSMGVAAEDVDGDGDEDLFVTNLPRETNTLYVNQGKGLFHDATDAWGLGVPSAVHTGFGTSFLDYDGDGWLDLFVANGAVTNREALRGKPYPFQETSQLFHHPGQAPFAEVSATAGPSFARAEVSRGVAAGDVDNDGDVDLLVTNNNGPVRLLLNVAPRQGSVLQVRLRGVADNRDGIGARVGAVREGAPTLWRRVHTDGSYLAASDPRVHFGLGGTRVREVRVRWPNGTREAWPVEGTGRVLTLTQGAGRALTEADDRAR
jgi:hypothetical protein